MNARFFLEQIRSQTQIEFDNIQVNSDAKDEIEIVFSTVSATGSGSSCPRTKSKNDFVANVVVALSADIDEVAWTAVRFRPAPIGRGAKRQSGGGRTENG